MRSSPVITESREVEVRMEEVWMEEVWMEAQTGGGRGKLLLLPSPFPSIRPFETRLSLGNWGSGVLIGPLSWFLFEAGGCGR